MYMRFLIVQPDSSLESWLNLAKISKNLVIGSNERFWYVDGRIPQKCPKTAVFPFLSLYGHELLNEMLAKLLKQKRPTAP